MQHRERKNLLLFICLSFHILSIEASWKLYKESTTKQNSSYYLRKNRTSSKSGLPSRVLLNEMEGYESVQISCHKIDRHFLVELNFLYLIETNSNSELSELSLLENELSYHLSKKLVNCDSEDHEMFPRIVGMNSYPRDTINMNGFCAPQRKNGVCFAINGAMTISGSGNMTNEIDIFYTSLKQIMSNETFISSIVPEWKLYFVKPLYETVSNTTNFASVDASITEKILSSTVLIVAVTIATVSIILGLVFLMIQIKSRKQHFTKITSTNKTNANLKDKEKDICYFPKSTQFQPLLPSCTSSQSCNWRDNVEVGESRQQYIPRCSISVGGLDILIPPSQVASSTINYKTQSAAELVKPKKYHRKKGVIMQSSVKNCTIRKLNPNKRDITFRKKTNSIIKHQNDKIDEQKKTRYDDLSAKNDNTFIRSPDIDECSNLYHYRKGENILSSARKSKTQKLNANKLNVKSSKASHSLTSKQRRSRQININKTKNHSIVPSEADFSDLSDDCSEEKSTSSMSSIQQLKAKLRKMEAENYTRIL